jgi:hypothetical protein
MNEELTVTETPKALVRIIEQSGLDKIKADQLLEKFTDLVGIAALWEAKAKEIVVTDESQTDLMKQAREGRLLLKEKRVEVEKTRKQLKDASLKEGRAIDSIAGFITSLIEPTEKYLDEQEKFAERKEAERVKSLNAERLELILPYIEGVAVMEGANYGAMPQAQFDAIYSGLKLGQEKKIADEKKAEEDRIAKEKADAEAREAQRIENERLKKEVEEREKQFQKEAAEKQKQFEAERKRINDEAKAAEEKSRKEREAIEAKLKEERAAAEKLKYELAQKAAAEKRREEEREKKEKEEFERLQEESRQAELAPDKTKLIDFANMLESIELPQLKSKKAKQLAEDTKVMIATAANHIRTNIKKI